MADIKREMATAETVALRQEMLGYDSCLISDALERLGLPAGQGHIHRQTTRRRIFGPAVTVKLGPFDGEAGTRHLGTAAIELCNGHEVIVVEHKSRNDCAGWGGLLSTAARARGVCGIVVDGLVRDVDEAEELDMPLFSTGVTPTTARGRVMEISSNAPVKLGNLVVNAGDYIIADGSGVSVIPQGQLMAVVSVARELMSAENGIRAQLENGLTISHAMDKKYETLLMDGR